MACGQPATTYTRTTFNWFPPWVYVLLLPAILVFAIVAMVLTKRMTVDVPVCNRHRGYWWKRTLLMISSLVATFVLTLGLAALLEQIQKEIMAYACVVFAAMFVVWVVLVAVIRLKMIRPVEITDNEITLTRVHPEFLVAFEEFERRSYRRRRHALDDNDEFNDRPDREDRPPRPPRDDRDTFRVESGD